MTIEKTHPTLLKWISVIEHIVITAFRRYKKKFANSEGCGIIIKNCWTDPLMTVFAILMRTKTSRYQTRLFSWSFWLFWPSNTVNFIGFLSRFVSGKLDGFEALLHAKYFYQGNSKKNRKIHNFHLCGLDWQRVLLCFILELNAMPACLRLLTTSSDLFLNGISRVD